MLVSQDEVDAARRAILSDLSVARQHLTQLATHAHATFLELCHQLLGDPAVRVQWVVFDLLGHYGDRNDPVAEASALQALSHPELQGKALMALGRVATPAALPVLFTSAEQGAPWAMEAVSQQVRTEEDKQRLRHLARQQLVSRTFRLHDAAFNALLQHSSAAAEAELLLEAVRLYYEELMLGASGKAPARVLPALQGLLAAVPPDSALYQEISRDLEQLTKRTSSGRGPASMETDSARSFKDYEEQLQACDQAIGLEPNESTLYNDKGVALLNLQRYEEAIMAFDQALALPSDYPKEVPSQNKGYALFLLKHYEEALGAYEQAIQEDPQDEGPYAGKVRALHALGRHEEALRVAEGGAQRVPHLVAKLRLLRQGARNEEAEQLEHQAHQEEQP